MTAPLHLKSPVTSSSPLILSISNNGATTLVAPSRFTHISKVRRPTPSRGAHAHSRMYTRRRTHLLRERGRTRLDIVMLLLFSLIGLVRRYRCWSAISKLSFPRKHYVTRDSHTIVIILL
jgi:hypothetical protein